MERLIAAQGGRRQSPHLKQGETPLPLYVAAFSTGELSYLRSYSPPATSHAARMRRPRHRARRRRRGHRGTLVAAAYAARRRVDFAREAACTRRDREALPRHPGGAGAALSSSSVLVVVVVGVIEPRDSSLPPRGRIRRSRSRLGESQRDGDVGCARRARRASISRRSVGFARDQTMDRDPRHLQTQALSSFSVVTIAVVEPRESPPRGCGWNRARGGEPRRGGDGDGRRPG